MHNCAERRRARLAAKARANSDAKNNCPIFIWSSSGHRAACARFISGNRGEAISTEPALDCVPITIGSRGQKSGPVAVSVNVGSLTQIVELTVVSGEGAIGSMTGRASVFSMIVTLTPGSSRTGLAR
jgi:hypothetical protein